MKARFTQTRHRNLEETKRISRILELTRMILVNPRRYLRRDLSSRFEVSERMIQKDLEIIRHGLRLLLAHSPEGYYFEETPSLPPVRYSFSEALALLLAVQAARRLAGISSSDLAAAIARLESLFPAEFAPHLRAAAGASGMRTGREHRQEMLRLLNLALIEGRKVRIVYETASRGGERNERVVCPYHLLSYVRSWHLIARCELREAVLVFKVDRISEAELLEHRYSIPRDFSVDDYLGMSWGMMRGDSQAPVDVALRFTPEAGRWVSEEHWHKSQRVEVEPDGHVLFRLHLPVTPEFVNWVLYYGSRVEVVTPESLREIVAEEHRRAAGLYGCN
ncbi:MAG TPA: WYL domain-containing protein [Syntrophobacter fumaroxidans]|nr:WYL domain-containing protein [Syntrophobacter fumaroxidans]